MRFMPSSRHFAFVKKVTVKHKKFLSLNITIRMIWGVGKLRKDNLTVLDRLTGTDYRFDVRTDSSEIQHISYWLTSLIANP